MNDDERKKLDDRWNTCEQCGVKKGEDKYNFVYDGKCRKCRDRIDKAYDFERAKEDGHITRDDSIMCPYCGRVVDQDLYDYHDSKCFECPECDKVSDMEIEHTLNITTTKREEKNDN